MTIERAQHHGSLDSTLVGGPVVRPVRPGALLPEARPATSPMDRTAARSCSSDAGGTYFFLQPSAMPLTRAQHAICLAASLFVLVCLLAAVELVSPAERQALARTTIGRGVFVGLFVVVVTLGYRVPRWVFQSVHFVDGSRIEVGSQSLTVPGFLMNLDRPAVVIPRSEIGNVTLHWKNGALTGLQIEVKYRKSLWFSPEGLDTNLRAVADVICRMKNARKA